MILISLLFIALIELVAAVELAQWTWATDTGEPTTAITQRLQYDTVSSIPGYSVHYTFTLGSYEPVILTLKLKDNGDDTSAAVARFASSHDDSSSRVIFLSSPQCSKTANGGVCSLALPAVSDGSERVVSLHRSGTQGWSLVLSSGSVRFELANFELYDHSALIAAEGQGAISYDGNWQCRYLPLHVVDVWAPESGDYAIRGFIRDVKESEEVCCGQTGFESTYGDEKVQISTGYDLASGGPSLPGHGGGEHGSCWHEPTPPSEPCWPTPDPPRSEPPCWHTPAPPPPSEPCWPTTPPAPDPPRSERPCHSEPPCHRPHPPPPPAAPSPPTPEPSGRPCPAYTCQCREKTTFKDPEPEVYFPKHPVKETAEYQHDFCQPRASSANWLQNEIQVNHNKPYTISTVGHKQVGHYEPPHHSSRRKWRYTSDWHGVEPYSTSCGCNM